MDVKAEALVVGAGPAGSTAAEELAKAGVDVALLDRAAFPRDKTCAGGLLYHALREFPHLNSLVHSYNRAVHLHPPSLSKVLKASSPPGGPPLLAQAGGRRQFDASLVERARRAGAQFYPGRRVTGLVEMPDRVELIIADGSVARGLVVVGADGARTTVGRAAGLVDRRVDPDDAGLAAEVEIALPPDFEAAAYGEALPVHLFLHYGGLPGYGWVFPRRGAVNVGLGTSLTHAGALLPVLRRFLGDLGELGLLPRGARAGDGWGEGEGTVAKPRVAQLPARRPSRPAATRRVLLAGDAGGFCSAATGEGIYYGMVTGRLAGSVAARALTSGDLKRRSAKAKALADYDREWRRTLGRELGFHYLVKERVLTSQRRCEKAVRWGTLDPKLGPLFADFLVGRVDPRGLGRKMAWHYLRCKLKEKLGRL
ncbi:MAG: hypothetical protein Kow0069_09370 [Promethearchaeota archaeon]